MDTWLSIKSISRLSTHHGIRKSSYLPDTYQSELLCWVKLRLYKTNSVTEVCLCTFVFANFNRTTSWAKCSMFGWTFSGPEWAYYGSWNRQCEHPVVKEGILLKKPCCGVHPSRLIYTVSKELRHLMRQFHATLFLDTFIGHIIFYYTCIYHYEELWSFNGNGCS
jgi:hypothetical protein